MMALVSAAMPIRNARERVHRHIVEWAQKEYGPNMYGAGRALARAVRGDYGKPMSEQWASGVLHNQIGVALEYLDDVAELLGVPPGDLVRRDSDHYLEVIPSEMRFLAHLRALPETARHHFLAWLDYMFGFQDRFLAEQKKTATRRTKIARKLRRVD